MSNNLLIVESHNDQLFIERLKQEINNTDFEISTPICSIDDYECLGGLSLNRLQEKLISINKRIRKDGLNKLGILLDADNEGIEKRVALINQTIKSLDPNLHITETNTWYFSKSLDIDISCHILNIDGQGELETLLKAIKANDSIFADCLNAWQQCLIANHKTISQKDFDKFWITVYGRYDCCSKKEAKQAGCRCNLQATLQKPVWDFNHPQLNELKTYLSSFN